eukprot:5678200-Pleurochrysis_carterae.AAC.1
MHASLYKRSCVPSTSLAVSYTAELLRSRPKSVFSLDESFASDFSLVALRSTFLLSPDSTADFSGLSRLLEAYAAWVAFAETRCGALSESMRSCADVASAGLCVSPLSLFLNPSAMLLLTAH